MGPNARVPQNHAEHFGFEVDCPIADDFGSLDLIAMNVAARNCGRSPTAESPEQRPETLSIDSKRLRCYHALPAEEPIRREALQGLLCKICWQLPVLLLLNGLVAQ